MSDKPLPEVKVVGVDYGPCSKCGRSCSCVSLESIAVIKEEYDQPCYSLTLCSHCLRGLDRRILNYRPHWNRPGTPSGIDDVEEAES